MQIQNIQEPAYEFRYTIFYMQFNPSWSEGGGGVRADPPEKKS